ncbi:aldose epimerase [Gorillibacterium massiliense]|uniref:aldose epimerase family protein n=1 Tax=Gorillibacterium massiliense TaxID=1280390 RepID=UPI0004B5B161|nr:aldose epimerase [Gorillibacterium massiliense]
MNRYQVSLHTDKYAIVELADTETNSIVRICPERGGIAINCTLHGKELFYLDKDTFYDPEANIRGGNPVLFPISGQLQGGQYEWEGVTYTMKNHGVARTNPWKVVSTKEDGEASVTLILQSSEETLKAYPFAFELLFTYRLQDGTLHIGQEYRNGSDQKMPMYPGFHPYFAADQKSIDYETDATRYLDLNDNQEKPIEGPISLENKVESFVLLGAVKPSITFEPVEGTRVRLDYSKAFKYVVLWSVEGNPFVCVEPWMAQTGELNRKNELVFVPPGETLEADLTISLVV